LIDIGVNLLHQQFEDDRDEVVARASASGISSMLIISTDLESTQDAIAFARSHDLFCTAGIHPHDAKEAPADYISDLTELAASPEVKAIGETGLDFNRNFSPPECQRQVFDAQIRVAASLRLPVFVHDRDSNGEVYRQLTEFTDSLPGVVVHCFTGSRLDLHRYLDAGYYIGVTGWVCDVKRGGELRELVREIPLDRLLIETDAPFLLPKDSLPEGIAGWPPEGVSKRHKRRNEPALLPLVAARIAELKGTSLKAVADATAANARLLFRLPEPA
jgi:TatD DNase family protein